ncbi:hypothetical protein evm_015019 [Chilo suppressalis]|nr:hypothetical protein evm_015019 [Chilo suppressalis]
MFDDKMCDMEPMIVETMGRFLRTLPVINAIEDAERSYIPTQSQRIKLIGIRYMLPLIKLSVYSHQQSSQQ